MNPTPAPATAPAPAPAPAPVEVKKEETPEQKASVEATNEETKHIVEKEKMKATSKSSPSSSSDTSTIHTGKVKWFNQLKGFGFIEPTDGGEDLFVHQTAIHKDGFRSLGREEMVEFKVVEDEQGRTRAIDVTGPGGAQVKGAR